MTVYVGSLGRMVPIYSTPSASVVAEERYSFTTTLEGRRKAQVRPVGRRTWTWSAGFADAKESAVLAQFAQGAWGPGPFVFVSADAPFTNLLTPGSSMCDPLDVAFTQGGPVELPDGTWAARSLLGDGVANVLFGSVRSPLLTGKPVSAGAWVQGSGAAARLNWYDSAGVFVGSATSTVTSSGGWVWSTLTVTPPAGAAGVIVSGAAASKAAGPVLVWGTTKPTGWVDGQGCAKAVVHGLSRSIEQSSLSGTYSNLGFTVTEVG